MTHPVFCNKNALNELVEVIAKTDRVNRKLKKAGLRMARFKVESQSRGEWPSTPRSTFDPRIDEDLSPFYYTGRVTCSRT